MEENQSLMTFPCDFQVKIIGLHKDTFLKEITAIIRNHFPDTIDTSIVNKPSKEGNYLSITVSLYVKDQATLDSLYRELTSHADIKMVL